MNNPNPLPPPKTNKTKDFTVAISVDTTEIDEAINKLHIAVDKANELNELLKTLSYKA